MFFQKPGRNSKNSKNMEEIQKTWRKFPKNLWPPCITIFIILNSFYMFNLKMFAFQNNFYVDITKYTHTI